MNFTLSFRQSRHLFSRTFTAKSHLKVISRSSLVNELKLPLRDVDSQYRNVTYIDVGPLSANLTEEQRSRPPLVILAGTAQTVHTYTQHLRGLAAHRRLIVIEMRCQGSTELLSSEGTMAQHCADFVQISSALKLPAVDLVGFSFGGRVALTVTANYPALVRRLSVTGVPLARPAVGKLILESWRQALGRGNIEDCAWSFILNGYSEDFIARHETNLPQFVKMIVDGNPNPQKVCDLITHSHVPEDDAVYSIGSCVRRVECPVQVIAGSQDRIAGLQPTTALAAAISRSSLSVFETGHLVPFEKPVEWRSALLDFVNGK